MEPGFRVELESITITCDDGAIDVPRLGRVARINIYDRKTYRGPTADLILDDEERISRVIDDLRKDPAAARQALERPVAVTFGLREAQLSHELFLPTDDDERRRKDSLAWAFERFPLVVGRMKQVYGLRLPRHLAVWAAFCRSLSPLEKLGLDYVGRSPDGIMIWFEDDGLERKTRDGLDARLEGRYRADPPELVTVMGGDTDGLHYGLWYDDPAELPSFVASNYARDSAETGVYEPTVLAELLGQLRQRIEHPEYENDLQPLGVHALFAALRWWKPADDQALADDGPRRWAEEKRSQIIGGISPALPPGAGDPRTSYDDYEARDRAYRTQEAQPIIELARAELRAGKPAFALVVGRELHWRDADDTRAAALELLCGAYEALGRHALAEIAKVHHAHRDLRSVSVFTGT